MSRPTVRCSVTKLTNREIYAGRSIYLREVPAYARPDLLLSEACEAAHHENVVFCEVPGISTVVHAMCEHRQLLQDVAGDLVVAEVQRAVRLALAE